MSPWNPKGQLTVFLSHTVAVTREAAAYLFHPSWAR